MTTLKSNEGNGNDRLIEIMQTMQMIKTNLILKLESNEFRTYLWQNNYYYTYYHEVLICIFHITNQAFQVWQYTNDERKLFNANHNIISE